ncbi:MAG TPA: hypothetical protein PKU97_12850, partial [Kofleriaceae bacterium]|nr:hypothetical protein [Kofleriaceae bacterium]
MEPLVTPSGRAAGESSHDGRRRAHAGGSADPSVEQEPALVDDAASTPPGWADGASELAALRRRLDDLSSQQRKGHATTHQLAESIAALVAGQRQRLRWLNLNSFIAYVIFTLLLGAAFYTLYARRADALGAEQRALLQARDEATARAERASASLLSSQQSSQRALAAYELYAQGQSERAAAAHAALAGQLTPLEDAALAAAREQAAKAGFDRAFEQGQAAFRAGNFAAAAAPLQQAVAAGEGSATTVPAARVALARYYLGASLARTGELAAATAALEAALSEGVDVADARYQLAMVLDRAGELSRARAEYEKFATAHPKLMLGVWAMRRAAVLARWGKAAPPLSAAG